MKYVHGEVDKCLPLLAPVDLGGSTSASSYIDLNMAASIVTFEVMFGNFTSTDTTQGVTVTVEGSTAGAATDTQTAMDFQYQLSSAVNTDSMGAVSAATSSGVLVDTTIDTSVMLVYVDPATVIPAGTDTRFIRIGLDPGAAVSASIVGVTAWYIPRYAQASQPSST